MKLRLADQSSSSPRSTPHPARFVRSKAGVEFNVAESSWRISPDHVVDLEIFAYHDLIDEGVRAFLEHHLRVNSASYVASQRAMLRPLCEAGVQSAVHSSMERLGHLDRSVLEAFSDAVDLTVAKHIKPNYISAFVRMYLMATDLGIDGFDDDVAAELDEMVIGNNPIGQAVLSNDPQSGPIPRHEMDALLVKLRDATERRLIPTTHLAVTWLFICFGCNSKNLRLIHESDCSVVDVPDGEPIYQVQVPRIKKRTRGERDQFRTRQVPLVVGDVLDQLVTDNRQQALYRDDIDRQRFDWPLFRAPRAREDLLHGAFDASAFRVESNWPGMVLKEVAELLDLRASNGSRLRLTPRRLRYTFAARLVADGAAPRDVADALDHSSLHYVMVYFNARLDAVEQIDKAVDSFLSPVADAFMGRVALDEADANGTGRPLRRISHVSPTMNAMRAVGSCGELGDCEKHAPTACYDCRVFIPFVDADHQAVLDDLLLQRERRLANGDDPRWTQINDRAIANTKAIIRRCAEMKDARE